MTQKGLQTSSLLSTVLPLINSTNLIVSSQDQHHTGNIYRPIYELSAQLVLSKLVNLLQVFLKTFLPIHLFTHPYRSLTFTGGAANQPTPPPPSTPKNEEFLSSLNFRRSIYCSKFHVTSFLSIPCLSLVVYLLHWSQKTSQNGSIYSISQDVYATSLIQQQQLSK